MQHDDGRRRIGPRPDHAVFEPQRGKIEKAFVGKRHGGLCPSNGVTMRKSLAKLLVHGFARGIEFGFGAGIVGAPGVQDRDEVGHGAAVLRHRPKIALRHDPAHVFFRARLDPDRVGAAKQQRVSLGVGNDAARRGDDGRLVLGDHMLERAALLAAERRRTGHFNQIGNAGAVFLFDPPVEFDERPAQMPGEHPAERRFAGSPQTDQRDAPRPVGAGAKRHARRDLLGDQRQFFLRHLGQQIVDGAELRGARTQLRQQRGGM